MIFYSSFEPVYLLLPIIGFIIGMFGTMLGGGGGFFFLPLLTLLIGVPPHVAVATSLAATIPICVVGSWGHYKTGNIHVRNASTFIVASMLGAFIGAYITGILSEKQLKVYFGIYAIVIAANMAYATWKKKKAEMETRESSADTSGGRIIKGSFFGLGAGLIAGTFGTSGTAPVLAGLFSMRMPLKLVIGTSLLVVLANTVFAVGAHFLVGKIDLTLVGFLSGGSIIGAITGTRILAKVNVDKKESNIKYVYALIMVAIGVLMMIN